MPTAEQKAEIKFFHPTASRRQLVEKVKKWRGNHKACTPGHRSGECAAPFAWVVVDRTWVIRADFAGVSIEPNMLATAKDEGKKGAYEEPTWKAKGWLEPEEAEGVVPTDEVKQFLIDRLVKERRVNMEHRKYEPARIDKECEELKLAAERANGLGTKKAGKE